MIESKMAMATGRVKCAILAAMAVLLGTLPAAAQRVVPNLPATNHDYYGYAVTNLPAHFQSPEVQNLDNTPADNPLTNAGATLGRVLFYDKQLSHDYSTACASCHQQSSGFGDPEQFSQGVNGQTGRHSMGLSNVGYYANGRAFWDERAASLEEQALMPIQDPVEMNLDLPTLVTRLENTPYYAELFTNAFGSPEVTPEKIGKAIAQFERSMVSYQSPFDDAYVDGVFDPNRLTPQQLDGFQIFQGGRGRCRQCHIGPAQIGDKARNVGLDSVDSDPGAGAGAFKTPSLRNAEVQGHFMHDGRFSSLEEVIEFYSTGVQLDNPNIDPLMQNADFTEDQKASLLAFLQSLTDWNFLTDEKFSDPFVFACDINADGDCGVDDLDTMLAIGPIADGITVDASNQRFDLNSDGVIDNADLEEWLGEAALVNELGSPYLFGDANLDGTVDGQDFLLWNSAKFTSTTAWSAGDFNGDGTVDGQDFLAWNQNKFTSSDLPAVPEPATAWLLWASLAAAWAAFRRR